MNAPDRDLSAARLSLALAVAAAMAGLPGPAVAQSAAPVPATQRDVLEAADAGRNRGRADAPIRIVEISDFECPFCARFHEETWPTIDSVYVRGGLVRYTWVSFPNSRHPRAWPAIEAAFCAGAAGRFWEMQAALFEEQDEWIDAEDPAALFVAYAERAGVDAESFVACVRNDLTAPLQVSDYDAALRSGITSTPFFVLGDSVAIRGVVSPERFRAAVDSVLAARGHAAP